MNNITLTPFAPNLIESTRSIGYSFETALADIVDNSISNLASRIDINFRLGANPYVAIIDNGVGMPQDVLKNAMRYGSSSVLETRKANDLGRFGLGLKMASMSQCRKLTVLSKQRNSINAVSWDLDHIHKTQDWSLLVYSKDKLKELKHYEELTKLKSGTVVIWENFDRMAETPVEFELEFNQKLDHADKHLSLVFHRYLESINNKNKMDMYFNQRKLKPIDPFFLSNKATQPLEEETLFINRVGIKVKPFVVPYTSKLTSEERRLQNQYKDLNLNQGLYIYRNKRLIVWGKWFYLLRESELNRLARVRIDLPNSIDEYWTIDVKKSNAAIPSSLKDPLKKIIINAVGKSEKIYRYRGRTIKESNNQHIWQKVKNREKIQYLVNRDLPIFKTFEDKLDDTQFKLFDSFIKSLEETFPYQSVYYDLAKDEEFAENTMTVQEVYDLGKVSLNAATSMIEKKSTLKILGNIDLFQKYPEAIRLLEQEL